ncbi:hypothetical protein [Nocardia flavorosea]|nr:hypothetical protein [Nocardia flavorosea]
MDDAAHIAVGAVRDESPAMIGEVRFVLFDAAAYDAFSSDLAR